MADPGVQGLRKKGGPVKKQISEATSKGSDGRWSTLFAKSSPMRRGKATQSSLWPQCPGGTDGWMDGRPGCPGRHGSGEKLEV
jgi:hypothetical protein